MKTDKIFKELETILPEKYTINLKLCYGASPDISICITINDIIYDFECSGELEARLSNLLTNLLKNYFNKK